MKNGETINVLPFNCLKILIPLGIIVCLLTTFGGSGSRDDGTEILSFTTAAVAAEEDSVFRLAVPNDENTKGRYEVEVDVEGILLSDDFSNGDIYNWLGNIVDDSAGIGNSSKWEILNGELRQSYFVESIELGDPYQESYHLGTFTYPNIGMSWQDYRLSVDVTPLPDTGLTLQGNDVGVMFRYQGINNYYRLTLNARYGFTRLEKKVAGSFSTLALDSRGYYENVTLRFIIEAKGNLIQVFLGDEPLFSVIDSDLDSGTIGLYCQDKVTFDNVLVTKNNPAPSIIISSPADYSVITTNNIDVSASATNVPTGASVYFMLDDGLPTVDSMPPYEVQFNTVSQGEHKVDATLRDGLGAVLAQDSNMVIGVAGDYYVTIGDSITNGFGDDDPSDNTSLDGRIIAIQGYQANLNDLLTSSLNYPHIVFNEGIGGDTSSDALGRIDSILERHSGSNKVLILLGTNDSAKNIPANTFKANMQSLVNKVVSSGREPWVALIPPVFNLDGTPNNTRNQLIQQYNNVITGQLSNISVGPDFYTLFLDKFDTHYADRVHPNGLGYTAIANEWNDLLATSPPTGFIDIPPGFWSEDYIYAIYNAGITTGCSLEPLQYCPYDPVNRAQMAAFLVRAVEGEPPADYCETGSPFSDVASTHPMCKYIKRLSELGITTGYSDGTYRPTLSVNRAQMAAFIVRAVEGEPPADYCETGTPFTDIDLSFPMCKYIKRLSELGITIGYPDGTYRPTLFVNRTQMAAFLARAFLGME